MPLFPACPLELRTTLVSAALLLSGEPVRKTSFQISSIHRGCEARTAVDVSLRQQHAIDSEWRRVGAYEGITDHRLGLGRVAERPLPQNTHGEAQLESVETTANPKYRWRCGVLRARGSTSAIVH